MFVVMTAQELIRKPPDYLVVILVNLLIWPIGGYLFGKAMWSSNEKYFGDENMRRPIL